MNKTETQPPLTELLCKIAAEPITVNRWNSVPRICKIGVGIQMAAIDKTEEEQMATRLLKFNLKNGINPHTVWRAQWSNRLRLDYWRRYCRSLRKIIARHCFHGAANLTASPTHYDWWLLASVQDKSGGSGWSLLAEPEKDVMMVKTVREVLVWLILNCRSLLFKRFTLFTCWIRFWL